MKKIFALLALVLGVVSCQTEPEGLDVNVGGEVETTVCVSLPEATRANSALGAIENVIDVDDDYTLRYIFQVFYKGDESNAKRQVIYTDQKTVSFPVRLVPGRHYNFVVWADVVPVEGKTLNQIHNLTKEEAAAADYHYNTLDLSDVRIIDEVDGHKWNAMDETRDAFTGQFDTAEDGNKTAYNSAKSINFTLTRPFAKLRVITTDMEQLNDLRILPTYATVEYTKPLYPSFNAFAGVVNDETSAAPHKTHYQYTIKTDYEYDFNNDEPKVLFTDYLFAPDYDHEVNFILTVYDQHGKGTENVIKTNPFNTLIPAHRNHLTTIKGNILTEGNNITVEVTKDFENTPNPGDAPYYQETISSDVELLAALAKLQEPGANYKFIITAPLTVDYSLISTFAATRATSATLGSVTINLNGFTVTFVSNSGDPVITLPAGSELTLVNDSDEGGIIVTGEGTGAAIQNNGSLNIEGVALESESNGTVIENNNVANIEGSTLNEGALVNNGEATIEESTLNQGAVENNGEATIEESTLNQGAVENKGEANVNGGNVDDNAIENGEGAIVGSQSAKDLERAISNAKKDEPNVFKLTGNVEGDVVVVIQQPDVKITIDGANHKFNGYFRVHSNSVHYATAAVTFKNINFETAEVFYNEDNEPYFNFIEAIDNGNGERYSTNITAEKCTFTATGAAKDKAVGLQIKSSKNAKVLNCTATDMHSLIQAQSCDETVVVKDCAINGKNGVAFKQVKSATVESTTITAAEYGIRFDGNTDNYGIVVKNNNITAAQPFIVRKMTGKDNTITLEGENTLVSTREAYQIVLTNGADDAAYVAPTGTYTLTGANDFIVYPRDVVSSWGEFTAALAANKTFFLLAEDITYDGNYQLQKDVVIDLNGKSMTLQMINIHKNVTIKNGTINGKMYARTGCNATLEGLTFSGTISDNLSTEGHLAIQGGCDVYAKNCTFAATTVNGSQTRSLSIEGSSSGTRKFEGCDFKFLSWGTGAGKYKKNVYINTMSGTTTVDFTNCKFNSKAPNIMFAGTYSLKNLTMSGCDNTAPTLEINRAKDTVTEEEWAHISSLIANNKFTQVRVFYAGGSSEYIK